MHHSHVGIVLKIESVVYRLKSVLCRFETSSSFLVPFKRSCKLKIGKNVEEASYRTEFRLYVTEFFVAQWRRDYCKSNYYISQQYSHFLPAFINLGSLL